MPRPMLKMQPTMKNQAKSDLQLYRQFEQKQTQMDKMQLDRLLRKTRSKQYMDAIHALDAGGHVHNQGQVDELVAVIKQEFPDVELAGILLGYVSKCYLGAPYEVHTLDLVGRIIEHYQMGQPLPSGMEKARGIALHGGYDYIEVYSDCCRAICGDGTVSVIS